MSDFVEKRPKSVTWQCLGWADCPYFHMGHLCDRCREQKAKEDAAEREGETK